MRRRSLLLLCLAVLLTACGPGAPLTERDSEALARVEEEFGGKLTFRPVDGLYLDARLRPNMQVSEAELDDLYRRFFLGLAVAAYTYAMLR